MEGAFKIRKAGPEDVHTIFGFISHLEETSFGIESFKERYADNLDNTDCVYLVAVNDQEDVIGFISCHGQNLLHHEGKVFEIQEMYVSKNYRDKGVGKALFASLQKKLADLGCESLEVTTHIKRTDARKFYTKLGFIQTHVKFVMEL